MNKNWNIFAYIGVGLSLVMSIIAICLASPRTIQTSFDYQGVIVGTLSILVTILIGWQIYNIINIQSSLDKFAHKMSKINAIEEGYKKMDIYNDAQTYQSSGHILYLQKRLSETLQASLKALNLYSQIETYKDSSECITICIDNCLDVLQELIIPKPDYKNEIYILNETIENLNLNPICFNSTEANKYFQQLRDLIIDRQKNIHENLTEEQSIKIKKLVATRQLRDVTSRGGKSHP